MSPPPSKPKSVHKHWHPHQGLGSECEVKRRHRAVTCDGGLREVKQNKRKETPTRRLGEERKTHVPAAATPSIYSYVSDACAVVLYFPVYIFSPYFSQFFFSFTSGLSSAAAFSTRAPDNGKKHTLYPHTPCLRFYIRYDLTQTSATI